MENHLLFLFIGIFISVLNEEIISADLALAYKDKHIKLSDDNNKDLWMFTVSPPVAQGTFNWVTETIYGCRIHLIDLISGGMRGISGIVKLTNAFNHRKYSHMI